MKTLLWVLCGVLLFSLAVHADQMSWAECQEQAKDMDIGVRRSPEWDIRPQLAYFDKECLQPYGYPDFDKVREVLVSVAPKRPGVYQ